MEQDQLTTSTEIINGIPILKAAGEIDIYTAPRFKEAITEMITQGHTNILIDMTEVAFMDSSGFGTLLSATKPLRPVGGSLSLCGCNEAITRMLEITRLNTLFRTFKNREEALQRLANGEPAEPVAAV
ncbi:MAG TPA: STAS domain-containing protein [Capsulimonadaceae bacterium]|nr:STAS domain-containing protein [Capsulimonadaceae bacterium]